MKPATIKSELTAYEFTEWLNDNHSITGLQGIEVVRHESGKVAYLMSGSRRITFDVGFAWEWRKTINDWIRGL